MASWDEVAASVGRPAAPKLSPKVAESLKGLQTTGKKITKAQPSWDDVVKQMQAGKYEKAPGGLLSVVSHIPGVGLLAKGLATTPVQTVFNVLDTPRAVVTSAIKEGQDVAFKHNNPQGGSVGDFFKQIIDPKKRVSGSELIRQQLSSFPLISRGVSQEKADYLLSDPKVKIIRGLAGFGLDVGLDPLMYTGVGEGAKVAEGVAIATKGLSKADLATKVFEEGSRLVKSGATTEDALRDVVGRVAARGKAGLTEADRATFNIPKLDYTFMGKSIPGSTAVKEVGEKAAGRVGEKVSTSWLGTTGRFLTKAAEDRAALTKIHSGEIDKVVQGIAQKAEIGANRGMRRHISDKLARYAKDSGLLRNTAADGAAVIHAVETGSLTHLAPAVRDLFATLKTEAGKAGVALEDLGRDYIPHQITKEARKIVRGSEGGREALTTVGATTTSPEMFRKITAGYENAALFGEGPLLTGTVQEANARFAAQHGVELFKTDLPDVILSYTDAIAAAAGRNAGSKRLVEMGLAKPIEKFPIDIRDTREVADLAATAERAQKDALTAHERATSTLQTAAEAAQKEQAVRGAVDTLKTVREGSGLTFAAERVVAAKEAGAAKAADAIKREGMKARTAAAKQGRQAEEAVRAAEEHAAKLKDTLSGADDVARQQNKAITGAAMKSPNPQVASTAKVESMALELESKIGNAPPSFESVADILANAQAREVLKSGILDGYKVLSKGYQAPEDLVDALRVINAVKEPKWWDGALRYYDQFNNYFKAWAVASPGFLVRNLYSGIFNNYVHGVPFADHVAFREMFSIYKKNPIDYMEIIAAKDGRVSAEQFQQALTASAATGFGQGRDEILRSVTRPKHFGLNPLTADNWYTRTLSKPNETVEAWLRGAHALHNLREGKTLAETINSVTKYHFNYQDLSDFDRAAKRVIPFWTFTARNIPLQMQILATEPWRLNTITHFKTNVESLSNPDEIVPSYFGEQNSIRLPFKLGTGGTNYLVPDLPIMRLNETLTHFTDPVRVFSDANPLIKSSIERYANKSLFSDLPYNNRLAPAPNWAKIPGIEQVLKQFGVVKDSKDGEPLMTDKWQATLESNLPILARGSRLLPMAGGQEKFKERQITSLLSFLGSSFATNTPSVQAGELHRRQKQLDELVNQLTDRGFIKKKTPKGKRAVA